MALEVGRDSAFKMLVEHRKNLSGTQMDMVRAAPEEQRPYLEAQFKLENEAQAVEQIGKFLKSDDTDAMAVIRNLG
ncbi:MAG: hypothetical protein ACJ8AT_04480 [Hyalangium sp.]|uniref:hypothetical protein n=1 Tax=Hyalangium sp. TaxID=2028555 RepID=UPI00389AC615